MLHDKMHTVFKKLSAPFLAFLQASGLVSYIILISLFFNFVAPNFSDSSENFYAPMLMLLLFVISAVISGLLVLGRAGMLFWEKKYKESFTLVGWTVGWGILYLLTFVLILSN